MKPVLYAIRSFGRELRSGEVVVLLAAVALAVAALTAVGFLTDRIGRAVERQANEVLAADLRLRTPDPIPCRVARHLLPTMGCDRRKRRRFPASSLRSDLSSLATIKGVSRRLSAARQTCALRIELFGELSVWPRAFPASGTDLG